MNYSHITYQKKEESRESKVEKKRSNGINRDSHDHNRYVSCETYPLFEFKRTLLLIKTLLPHSYYL